jgi:hypothetical protein
MLSLVGVMRERASRRTATQRAGRLIRGHWCRRTHEVANTRGSERKTDEDEGTRDHPADRAAPRNVDRLLPCPFTAAYRDYKARVRRWL